jgi:hypothetical protein
MYKIYETISSFMELSMLSGKVYKNLYMAVETIDGFP